MQTNEGCSLLAQSQLPLYDYLTVRAYEYTKLMLARVEMVYLSSITTSSSSRSASTSLAKDHSRRQCPHPSLVSLSQWQWFVLHWLPPTKASISTFRAICACCDVTDFERHRVVKGVNSIELSRRSIQGRQLLHSR